MNKLVAKLVQNRIIDKNSLLDYVSNNKGKIYLSKLIDVDLLDKNSLYEYIESEFSKNKLNLEEIEKLELEGLDVNELFNFIAKKSNKLYIDLHEKEFDASLLHKIPIKTLIKNKALVIEESDLYVIVVFEDPFDLSAQDTVSRFFSNKILKVAIALPTLLKEKLIQIQTYESLKKYVDEVKDSLKNSTELEEDESPGVMKLIDLILRSSIIAKASDIHIEVTEKNTIVRDRVDGMLQQRFIFERIIFSPLASRLKLLSNLDIAERRKPQDGRFSHVVDGREFDFRVSTLPTLIGESIVMRILDKSKTLINLEDMGMNEASYKGFTNAIEAPYGIVLVTGPTGSGKTTTLYGALNAIKSTKDKIITVEDPVEYQMPSVQQVQVNNAAGLTFAAALRSILRQDPDKIMIGEIRDKETLQIAIQAAMTGHLVLSTLHTNSAIASINRMIDMGIESFLVSGSLVAIQAQRLVRKICSHCKEPTEIKGSIMDEISEYLKDKNPTFYKGKGCKYCNHSGYAGREMISEVLTVSNRLSRMIAAEASEEELEKQAKSEGFITMFEDGIEKALQGRTTIEEIFRVARL